MFLSVRRIASSLALVLFIAFPAFASLSEQWRDWADGPVKFLMTEREKGEWARLSTDEEAERFVELFWARRDPSPGTDRNEHREIFDQRVAYADENFGSGRIRGALTDRGRVFLLLGAPYRIKRSGAPSSTIQSGFGGGAENARGANAPTDVWFYEKEARQPWMGNHDFEVSFVDYYGDRKYELNVSPRLNVNPILEKAVEVWDVSPDLQQVPSKVPTVDQVVVTETPATEFQDQRLKAAWEDFEGRQDDQGTKDLHVTWGQYQTPGGRTFVPVQLFIPASSDLPHSGDVTFFGVLENEAGEIAAVYEEPLALTESKGDAFVDKSLQLDPGRYEAVFGIARDGNPVAMKRTEMDIKGADEGAGASEIILSNNVYPLSAAQAETDPYAFGGLKVVPKGDRDFPVTEDIWYVIEIRSPGLGENGAPSLQIKLDVSGETADGTPVRMSAPTMPAPVTAVRDTAGHYMLGSSFPAGAFKPGSYVLKARLLDSVTKKTWNFEAPFTVHE